MLKRGASLNRQFAKCAHALPACPVMGWKSSCDILPQPQIVAFAKQILPLWGSKSSPFLIRSITFGNRDSEIGCLIWCFASQKSSCPQTANTRAGRSSPFGALFWRSTRQSGDFPPFQPTGTSLRFGLHPNVRRPASSSRITCQHSTSSGAQGLRLRSLAPSVQRETSTLGESEEASWMHSLRERLHPHLRPPSRPNDAERETTPTPRLHGETLEQRTAPNLFAMMADGNRTRAAAHASRNNGKRTPRRSSTKGRKPGAHRAAC